MTNQQKTLPTDQSVDGFLNTITPLSKRTDCEQLRQIFEEMTGYPAVMWGDTMIGLGIIIIGTLPDIKAIHFCRILAPQSEHQSILRTVPERDSSWCV